MQILLERRNLLSLVMVWSLGCSVLHSAQGESSETKSKVLAAPIQRRPVKSASLASVGYHPDLRILEIAFRSGAVYRYVPVPLPTFEGLVKAESKGRYFTQHIRTQFHFYRLENTRP